MSEKKGAIKKSTLDAIGNAIREKEGSTEPIPVNALADRIGALKIASGNSKVTQMIEGTATEITAEDMKGITTISKYALYRFASLESLYIPSTVTTIDSNAFFGCTNLTNVYIDDLTSWCYIKFVDGGNPLQNQQAKLYIKNSNGKYEHTKKLVIDYMPGTSTSRLRFYGYSNLEELIVKKGSLKEYDFTKCSNLKTVRLGKGTSATGYTFTECPNLTDIYTEASSMTWAPFGATNATIHYNTPLPSEEA